jgi:hypothetical protein
MAGHQAPCPKSGRGPTPPDSNGDSNPIRRRSPSATPKGRDPRVERASGDFRGALSTPEKRKVGGSIPPLPTTPDQRKRGHGCSIFKIKPGLDTNGFLPSETDEFCTGTGSVVT